MIPTRVIERKRDGESLEAETLEAFLRAYLSGEVRDYQMSAFLMATYFVGLDERETDVFVRTMLESGTTLDLSHIEGPRVDKHSTGGVGDKVSLVLAPLAACLGLHVPMMSGRGLGHTTGTLDKLEAIPGFRTRIALDEFVKILDRVGCAMIGQTEEIAPLDRIVYGLRDVTGTVPVRPLIAASIMSKKLAEGLTGLVLDVKVGSGAFLPEEDRALELAHTMVGIGRARGLPTVALLTAMDRPLGRAIGNALETIEAIECLRGEGPPDLRALVVRQVAEMLRVGGLAADDLEATEGLVVRALDSGEALERFGRLIEAQGGDPSVIDDPTAIRTASERRVVLADHAGIVRSIEPRALGQEVIALGGGRVSVDQEIDLGVGFVLDVTVGDTVAIGDRLGTVFGREAGSTEAAAERLREVVTVGDEDAAPLPRPLVSHRISSAEGASRAG